MSKANKEMWVIRSYGKEVYRSDDIEQVTATYKELADFGWRQLTLKPESAAYVSRREEMQDSCFISGIYVAYDDYEGRERLGIFATLDEAIDAVKKRHRETDGEFEPTILYRETYEVDFKYTMDED